MLMNFNIYGELASNCDEFPITACSWPTRVVPGHKPANGCVCMWLGVCCRGVEELG